MQKQLIIFLLSSICLSIETASALQTSPFAETTIHLKNRQGNEQGPRIKPLNENSQNSALSVSNSDKPDAASFQSSLIVNYRKQNRTSSPCNPTVSQPENYGITSPVHRQRPSEIIDVISRHTTNQELMIAQNTQNLNKTTPFSEEETTATPPVMRLPGDDPDDPGWVPIGDGILPLLLLSAGYTMRSVVKRRH